MTNINTWSAALGEISTNLPMERVSDKNNRFTVRMRLRAELLGPIFDGCSDDSSEGDVMGVGLKPGKWPTVMSICPEDQL